MGIGVALALEELASNCLGDFSFWAEVFLAIGLPRSSIDARAAEEAEAEQALELHEVTLGGEHNVLSVDADRMVDAGVCGVCGKFLSMAEAELNNALGSSFRRTGGGVAGIYMVPVGDLGGTLGRLSAGNVGEYMEAGVLHSSGENIGESGRVGLHR
jgi:hypothetical protein